MMFRSDGAIASEPIEETGCSSNTDFHVAPASVDVQTPPDAVAAKYVDGSPATPATRDTRPPAAGPMLRYLSALNSFGESRQTGLGSSCARTAARKASENRHTTRRKRNRGGEKYIRRVYQMAPRSAPRAGCVTRLEVDPEPELLPPFIERRQRLPEAG